MGWWSNEVWKLRYRANLSQTEAARACFVDRKTWYRWEKGLTEPPAWVKEGVRDYMAREIAAFMDAQDAMRARLSELSRVRP